MTRRDLERRALEYLARPDVVEASPLCRSFACVAGEIGRGHYFAAKKCLMEMVAAGTLVLRTEGSLKNILSLAADMRPRST